MSCRNFRRGLAAAEPGVRAVGRERAEARGVCGRPVPAPRRRGGRRARGDEEIRAEARRLQLDEFSVRHARHCARLVKKEFPGVLTAVGGYHATLLYMEMSEGEDGLLFDFIIRGGRGQVVRGAGRRRRGRQGLLQGARPHVPGRRRGLSQRAAPPGGLVRKWPSQNGMRASGRATATYNRGLDVLETSRGCVMPCTFLFDAEDVREDVSAPTRSTA